MDRLDFLMGICEKLEQEDKNKIKDFMKNMDMSYDMFKFWFIKESPTKIQYYLDIPYFAIVELGEKIYND